MDECTSDDPTDHQGDTCPIHEATEDQDYPTGEACVDCLMLLANGETPPEMDENETQSWLELIGHRTEGFTVVPACEEECKGSFSMSPCDVCGSHLGGDRHPVVFLPKETTT